MRRVAALGSKSFYRTSDTRRTSRIDTTRRHDSACAHPLAIGTGNAIVSPMSWKHFTPRVLVALAIGYPIVHCALGCNSQSNGMPSGGASVSAAVTAPISTPQGPFPRGTPNPASAPDPAKTGPRITILAPERGAQLSANTVAVRLRAVDPDGVGAVLIMGAPASAVAGDEWGATVSLGSGLNVITIEATDLLGNRSTSYVSVTGGAFVPDDQVMDGCIGLGMTPDGLVRVADVAEQQLATLDIFGLLAKKNPIVDTAAIKVRLDALRHQPPQLEAEGRPTGLKLTVHLDQPVLDASVTLVGIPVTRATVTAARATAVVEATIDRAIASAIPNVSPAQRALGLRVDSITVTFDQFAITASTGVVDLLLRPFRGLVERTLEDKLEDVLSTAVVDVLGKSLTGIDRPLVLMVPGLGSQPPAPIEMRFGLDRARGWAGGGVEVVAGGICTAGVTSRAPANPSRQVLSRSLVAAPTVGPEPFTVKLTSDAVNMVMHAMWRTGGLGLRLDGTVVGPTTTMLPSVKLLYPFIPQVRDVAPDPDTPICVEISMGTAPTIDFGTPTAAHVLSAGEVEVRALIDYMDGQPPAELFVLRAAMVVEADITVSATTMRLSRLAAPQARVDIVAEPLCDLADQEIEDFFNNIMPWLLDRYAQNLPGFPIPALPLGLQLQTPRTETSPGVLTVRAGL